MSDGKFDWAAPDEEVHSFVNDLERPIGTYLYGRRMYETMVYWETAHAVDGQPRSCWISRAIWQAADKVVYSRTLETAASARTRIERDFDPEAIRQLKAGGGARPHRRRPGLAAEAFGPGWSTSSSSSSRRSRSAAATGRSPTTCASKLELLEERRFGNGTVYVRYRTAA